MFVAIGANDPITWGDLLFVAVGIAVVLLILILIRRV